MKIFIDTNIFLGFYEENQDHIKKVFDLSKIKKYLVLIDYCWYEYYRNRSSVFDILIREIVAHQSKDPHRTSFISGFEEYNQAKDLSEKTKEAIRNLENRTNKVKIDPTDDPVYQTLLELYSDKSIKKYQMNEKLIDLAKKRRVLGNPPMTKDKVSVGDELIWEILLENVNDDLVIVSRDKTFNTHFDFLRSEFQTRTGKTLFICKQLKDAFDKVGESASQDLKNFEEKEKEPVSITDQSGNIILVPFPQAATFLSASTSSPTPVTFMTYCHRCGQQRYESELRCVKCGYTFGCD